MGLQVRSTPAPVTRNHSVVGVRLEYRHEFLTGIFGGGKTLADESVQSFEPISTFDDPDAQCKP